MKPFLLRVVAGSLLLQAGCQVEPPAVPGSAAGATTGPDDVRFEEIRPDVWVHSTYRRVEGFGNVRSNGLAIASGGRALLVDTAWSDDADGATRALLDEILRTSGAAVIGAVLTHYHDDSVAGIGALHRDDIPTYATSRTADLMEAGGRDRPSALFSADGGDTWTLPLGERDIEVFYPGPGHTDDNVVVFVPHARVLYGGCLVRPGDARSLGNTADADIERWAVSVARVRDRYGDRADVVVPSHGPARGPELLDHTIALVESYRDRAVD